MIVPDSSLLLYAYNTASPKYSKAKAWWEACLSGSEPVGLPHPVTFAFIRISTSTSAFPTPYSLEEVRAIVDEWFDRSQTRIVSSGLSHISEVISLLQAAGSAGGNLTTEAQIAAIAKSHNATVHTADQDFRRFPGVKLHYPL